jgi:hypothetical protein
MDITDIYREFHPTTMEYTLFSAAHETFSKTDHILRYKASISKFKQIEVTPCIISDCNSIKLDLVTKEITENIQTCGD